MINFRSSKKLLKLDKDIKPIEVLKSEEKEKRKQYYQEFKKKNPNYHKERLAKGKLQNYEKALFYQTMSIAKRRNIEFNLKIEDIIIPEKCPLTETVIVKGMGKRMDNPYVFILNTEKGYCKENILVTCLLANYIRSYASKEQLIAMAKNWFNANG